jgi:hypothetical protein
VNSSKHALRLPRIARLRHCCGAPRRRRPRTAQGNGRAAARPSAASRVAPEARRPGAC